jgi:acyl-CoA thioesterase
MVSRPASTGGCASEDNDRAPGDYASPHAGVNTDPVSNRDERADSEVELPPVDRTWWSWSGAHGGLLAALLLRHAGTHAPELRPRSLYMSLLVPADARPLRCLTEVMRRGGSSAVTRSLLYQGEALVLIGTALLAGEQDGSVMQACPAPPVPPADECPPEYPPVEVVPFVQHVDFRMAGDARPLGGGPEPVLTAWLRLKEPASSPAEMALVLLDSMPPALYAAMTEPVVAPTADFAVHFADGLATAGLGDWTLIRTQVEQASSGWMVDSIRPWRPDGTLLATARQTRRILA